MYLGYFEKVKILLDVGLRARDYCFANPIKTISVPFYHPSRLLPVRNHHILSSEVKGFHPDLEDDA